MNHMSFALNNIIHAHVDIKQKIKYEIPKFNRNKKI